MGMYDRIVLIEPLPCFECKSTSKDEVGSLEQTGKIELGESTLKVVRLHDGTGGIKG